MDACVAGLEVTVRTDVHVPVVRRLRVDVLLVRNHHVVNPRVALDEVLLRRDVDVEAQREVDVPTIRQEVFRLKAHDVDQAVTVEPVDVEVVVPRRQGLLRHEGGGSQGVLASAQLRPEG